MSVGIRIVQASFCDASETRHPPHRGHFNNPKHGNVFFYTVYFVIFTINVWLKQRDHLTHTYLFLKIKIPSVNWFEVLW